jgi:hypothetical protein
VIRERTDIAGRIRKIYRRGKWPASDAWAEPVTEVVNELNRLRLPPKPKRRRHGRADDPWALCTAFQRTLRAERERLHSRPEFMRSLPYRLVDNAEKAVTALLDYSGMAPRRRGRPRADWYIKPQLLAFGLQQSLIAAGRTASFTYRGGPGVGAVVELLKLVGEKERSRKAVWDALRALRVPLPRRA